MPQIAGDDGVALNYAVRGSGGASVVYLHGMGGNVGTWQRLWDELAAESYQHVGLDFRGHGGSTRSPCELTNERSSRDVLNLADALGLEHFAVVGHSMGGKVAMRLAAMAPDRILGLALIGSPGPGLVPLRREDVAEFMATYQDVAVTEAFFRPWFKVWPNATVDDWIRSFSALPEWALHAAAEMSIWTNIAVDVRGVKVPALLIAGDDDPVYGSAYQRQEVLPFFPAGRLVSVPDCGHGLILERPREIALHVGAFLREVWTPDIEGLMTFSLAALRVRSPGWLSYLLDNDFPVSSSPSPPGGSAGAQT
ncbi:MAG: alpha/beta hydrolase [Hyphomicrobiaceae bacterium]